MYVDKSSVYRRRRLAVLAGAVVLLWGVTSCTVAVTKALTGNSSDKAGIAAVPAGPKPRTGKAPTITLAFAGDTQAHGKAGRINDVGLGETGKVLAAADLSMVNLETVVAADRTGLKPQSKTYTFATGPKILDSLKSAGVDVVTAANNHTMDYGDLGMERMLQVKSSSPIPMVGLGKDDGEAWAPWTTEVKGRKVVVFGATDVLDDHLDWKAGPGKPGLAKIKDDAGFTLLLDRVKQARAESPDDVIVVFLHSGVERVKCPTARQQLTDKTLADAGADVVIGSHAHQLQPATTIGNTAIAYGMGNFVFESRSAETRATGVLTVTVPGTQGAPTMEFAPASITDGLPVLLTGAQKDTAVASWKGLSNGCS